MTEQILACPAPSVLSCASRPSSVQSVSTRLVPSVPSRPVRTSRPVCPVPSEPPVPSVPFIASRASNGIVFFFDDRNILADDAHQFLQSRSRHPRDHAPLRVTSFTGLNQGAATSCATQARLCGLGALLRMRLFFSFRRFFIEVRGRPPIATRAHYAGFC